MIKKQNAGIYDQFYTKIEIAKQLIDLITISQYQLIIQPSAGDGSFSLQINHPNVIAYDIDPKHQSIIKQDFLLLDIKTNTSKTLVIGNPPFGRQSSLALKFIKKSMQLADTVAFILPKSFKKNSYKDKVPLTHTCQLQIDLYENSFIVDNKTYSVPCIFQLWKKTNNLRSKSIKYNTDDFIFCSKQNAQLAIRRVGWYAGRVFEDVDKSQASFYFIKRGKKNISYVKNILQNICYQDIKNNTSGIRSISKNQIIMKYLGE